MKLLPFIFWIVWLSFSAIASKAVEESTVINNSPPLTLECKNEPSNLTIDNLSKTSTSFKFTWDSPPSVEESPYCKFSHYKISIDGPIDKPFRLSSFHLVASNQEINNNNWWILRDLEPGRTYVIMVQGVNNYFSSIAAVETVTLKPLSVNEIQAVVNDTTGWLEVSWQPDNTSYQDKYKIQYGEIESNCIVLTTVEKNIIIRDIIPGRNYSISVTAISKNVESKENIIYQFIEAVSPEKNMTRWLEIDKIEMKEKMMREQKNILERIKKKLTAMRIKARDDVDIVTYDLISKWRQKINYSTKCFESSRGKVYDKQKLIHIQIKNCVNNQLTIIREKEQSGEIFNNFLQVSMDLIENETSSCLGNAKLFLEKFYKSEDEIIEKCIY